MIVSSQPKAAALPAFTSQPWPGPRSFTASIQDGRTETRGESAAQWGMLPDEDGTADRTVIHARWNYSQGCFQFQGDRYGFLPFYYYYRPERFGVSTSILELVENGAPTELDDAALSVFLRLGYFVGDDTPLRGVRAVPPACRLTWHNGDLRLESHPPRTGSPTTVSRSTAIEAYGSLFQAVIERTSPGAEASVGLPLSGGRDSRHILFALMSAGRPPGCCLTVRHFPPKPDEDATIAARLTKHFGLPHVVLEQSGRPVLAEQRKNELTSFCSLPHAWILPLCDYVRRAQIQVLYDGIGGGILSAGSFLTEQRMRLLAAGKLRELADDILMPEGYLSAMLSDRYYRRWSRALAIYRVQQEIERHLNTPNPITQFYFWNRTRRMIALSPWTLLAGPAQIAAPYLDPDIYELLSALPPEYLVDHTFHTETIHQHYPQWSHFPFEDKATAPTRGSRWHIARTVLDVSCQSLLLNRSPYIRSSFLTTRLLKGLIDGAYGTRLSSVYAVPIYFAQLSMLQEN